MVRDRLRRIVRGVARRVVRGSPRIPNAGETERPPPTTREAWQAPAPEPEPAPEPPDLELEAAAVIERMNAGEDVVLIDVREAHELWSGHARGAILAPMSQFQGLAPSLPDGPLLAIYCAAGARSYGIADYLRQNGRPNAWSIPEGFGGFVDAGGAWLQPSTKTDWKLLQPARLTPTAAQAHDRSAASSAGQIQAVEATEDGPRITLRTRAGERISGLTPDDLEAIGRG